MNNQTVTYSELNLAKKPKRQQIKPKDADSCFSVSEREIIYVGLNLHSASQDLQKNDKTFHCKGKLIAGTLGLICLVLTAGIITMTVTSNKQNFMPMQICHLLFFNSTWFWIVTHILFSANHCHHCPEDWFSYSNHCYYISSDIKNWTESRMACVSKKSNLFYMDNEEEM
ncbi:NKG2-A/NKG2-B type II integral membrane protein-like, partial [Trichechus manatus latirostris]|uniref:NKG2-A/NKG2-B type II integral membrane protein-like n=1 Tax=Trichechus manatus latirostris TaxID=127582 RepID=A0A2Y9QQX0_TRIMA